MDKSLKIPPASKQSLSSPQELTDKLKALLGRSFALTGKSRTDGSKLRKLVGETLSSGSQPVSGNAGSYDVVPPKRKGVPKILLEYVDTYIVTSGDSYNLQVWNRNPSSDSVQVQYANGETLKSSEVRFILARVKPGINKISAIAVLSPDYIVKKFGAFGKPTIKHQLMISTAARQKVLAQPGKVLFYDDGIKNKKATPSNLSSQNIHAQPTESFLLPLSVIRDIVKNEIIGKKIDSGATKNRGQVLEAMIARSLGYKLRKEQKLAGGYPDICHQALEVKIQDSPTVDLGKYSPEYDEVISGCSGFTTKRVRYLIALTNPETNIVEGAILCPGNRLGQHFTYVAEKSYKCQRAIPMSFFDGLEGKCVFNP